MVHWIVKATLIHTNLCACVTWCFSSSVDVQSLPFAVCTGWVHGWSWKSRWVVGGRWKVLPEFGQKEADLKSEATTFTYNMYQRNQICHSTCVYTDISNNLNNQSTTEICHLQSLSCLPWESHTFFVQ